MNRGFAGTTLRLVSIYDNVGFTITDHARDFSNATGCTITIELFTRNVLESVIEADLEQGSVRYDAFVASSQWVPQFVDCCQDVPFHPSSKNAASPSSSSSSSSSSSFSSSSSSSSSSTSSSRTSSATPHSVGHSNTGKDKPIIPALYSLTTAVRSVDTSQASDASGYQWYDVLPFWQKKSLYRGEIYSIPLDGDVHFLYFRTDVLARFDLNRPATWEDMLEISNFLQGLPDHMRDWNGDGQPDYATCISSASNDATYWWPWTIAAASLQTTGLSQGIHFDTSDILKPNTASLAFQKALSLLQALVKTSPTGANLADCRQMMIDGRAAFSLDWGDTIIMANSSAFRDFISVGKTPGSTQVMVPGQPTRLVNCTLTLCPYALIDSRGRIVNYTPFAAFGGWSAYVSSRASAASQQAAVAFFTKIGAPAQSLMDVMNGGSGFQAYRYTHLDASSWRANAFSPQSISGIITGVKEAISHPNMAVDLSVPMTPNYTLAIDPYLQGLFNGTLSVQQIALEVTQIWNQVSRAVGAKTQTNNYRTSLGLEPITFRYETHVSEGARISVVVLSAVAIALDLVYAAVIIKFRDNRIIKWSSVSFLLLMCLGALLVYIGLIVWMATPSTALCIAALILILYGLFTLMSSIFSRTFRLWYIFQGVKKHRKRGLTDMKLSSIVVIILTLLSVLIIVWCAVDEPQPVYTISGFADDEFAYVCSSPDYPWAWFGAACGYFGSLLVVGMVLTWSTRNIVRSLNESRFLLLAVYNMSVCLGVFIVIALTVPAAIMMILLAYIVLLATFSSICLMLVPKFWGVFTNADVSLFFTEKSKSGSRGSRRSSLTNRSSSQNGPTSNSSILPPYSTDS